MNREKSESIRKYKKRKEGLSVDEISSGDLEDEINARISMLGKKIHKEKFPEEYEFMCDSVANANKGAKNINPMSINYIGKINKRREESGVSPLSENGLSSEDTFTQCIDEARERVLSDINLKRPPAEACVFCGRTIREVGGFRLATQKLRGTKLSYRFKGGGNADFPHYSLLLFKNKKVYMVMWGEPRKWSNAAIERAKEAYQQGKRPWFCQVCGERTCRDCGSPINYPVGSDILHGNGSTSHAPILGANPGCSNPNCKNYKSFNLHQS